MSSHFVILWRLSILESEIPWNNIALVSSYVKLNFVALKLTSLKHKILFLQC